MQPQDDRSLPPATRRHDRDLEFDSASALHALHTLPDGCCALSPEWRIVFLNAAGERLVGVPTARALGASVWDVLPWLPRGEGADLLRATMSDGEPRRWHTTTGPPEGAPVEVTAARLPSAGLALHLRDASAALRAERPLVERMEQLVEQAQAANRAKNDFMATMSHELRTPLAALAGYEELLVDGILGPLSGEQRVAIERMRWSTQLLTAIIEEILIFSRLEAGEMEVHPRTVDAKEILSAAGAVLEPLAEARDLAFGTSPPATPLAVHTDPDLLRRVLVNLGSNAIKFTDRGSVELAAAERGEAVHFSVRDTGIGIAPADVARLFEPFTQLDGSFTRRHGGTGLGLHTAARLTRLLGGRIEVASTPGEGSTFTVVLPRREPG